MSPTKPRDQALISRIRASLNVLLVTGVLGATGASSIHAQTTPQVEPGSRVRITAPSVRLEGAVGVVEEVTSDAIVVRFPNPHGVGTVERSEIVQMDVSIRRERRVLNSLWKGFVIGAAGGALLGLGSGDDHGTFLAFTAEEKALMAGTVFGLTGGVIGLVVGVANQHDVWAAAYPQGLDVTVLPVPRDGGVGLHVGVSLPIG